MFKLVYNLQAKSKNQIILFIFISFKNISKSNLIKNIFKLIFLQDIRRNFYFSETNLNRDQKILKFTILNHGMKMLPKTTFKFENMN